MQEDLRASAVLVPPTITFEKEMTLHLDDVDVRLAWYGHSHGVGDTVVTVPQENLVLTAGSSTAKVPALDAVAEQATPAVIDNWFVVMRRVLAEANDETKFLASHSRAVMKKGQYQEFVSYLEGVWSGVGARERPEDAGPGEGRGPLAKFPAIAKLPNEELRGTEWENLDIHGHNVERLWKVLDRGPPDTGVRLRQLESATERLAGRAGMEARPPRRNPPAPLTYREGDIHRTRVEPGSRCGLCRCPADRRIPDASFQIRLSVLVWRPLRPLPRSPRPVPAASPKATVTQKVGLTDVTVRYSRPAVNGRKVWGGLVPYGEVWRTGADENTTLSFSTPVTVGGKTLPAGTYGLHTMPGEKSGR